MPEAWDFLPTTDRPRSDAETLEALVSWAVEDMRTRLETTQNTWRTEQRPVVEPTGRWARLKRFSPMAPAVADAMQLARRTDAVMQQMQVQGLAARTRSFLLLAGDLPLVRDDAERRQMQAAVFTGLFSPAILGEHAARTTLQRSGFFVPHLVQQYYSACAELRRGSNAAESDLRARAAGQVVRDVLSGRVSGTTRSAPPAFQPPATRDRSGADRHSPRNV